MAGEGRLISDESDRTAFDLFSELLDLEPADRAGALSTLRQQSGDLADEVESLLAAHAQSPATFLLRCPISAAEVEEIASGEQQAGAWRDRTGETLGPYRLVQEIGAGGMGRVWLAERADGEFQQRVAIKLIRRGLDTEEILHRFRRERQVLAGLEHPNIARLLDGGSAADGLPYLVMEYVAGARIDTHCDERRFSIDDRVRLFLEVCGAVQHAHRNLVVHRDLKPGNILVNEEGTPKLLDFGIAKLLRSDMSGPDRTVTTGLRMTPAYASPEQVRGEAVTTAADVYALGMILYELLTGRRAYELGTATPGDAERVICDTPPTRPHAAVVNDTASAPADSSQMLTGDEIAHRRSTDLHSLRRHLAGDLEKILLMALRKEPQRRYQSAEAFSEDLRRYLRGLPVAAQPDSVGYRTRRFVGRHRVGVAVAAVMAAVLIGASVTSTIMFLKARDAQARAQEESLKARDAQARAQEEALAANTVSSYLRDMIGSIDPVIAQGRDVSLLREMLDTTADRLQRQSSDSPRVRGELHLTVGRAYHAIGDYGKAEQHLAQSVRLRRAEGSSPALEESLGVWATTLREQARYQESIEALNRLIGIRTRRLEPGHYLLGQAIAMLGSAQWASGDYQNGEQHLREAIRILRADPDTEPQQLATALRDLGGLLSDEQQFEEALTLLLEAREILQREHGDLHPAIARVESSLGGCARRSGRLDEAVAHHRRALEIREQLLDPDHPSIGYSLTGLGSALEGLERYEEAERLYLRALEIDRAALGESHTETGTAHNNLGTLYRKMGRFREAADHLEAAIASYSAARGPDDFWTSIPWGSLSRVHLQARDYQAALAAVDECLRIRLLDLNADDPRVLGPRMVRAAALGGLGEFQQAEEILLGSYERLQEQLPAGHPMLDFGLEAIVELYEAWGRPELAAEYRVHSE